MGQIKEDYVSFETAKLLKEKGFDWIVTRSFFEHDNCYAPCDPSEVPRKDAIAIPTLQMAMRWLREVHNKIIVPGISLDDRTSNTINHYIVGIWYIPENNGGAFCYTSPTPYNGYSSFEEACEDAIKYCLENLI